MSEQRYRGISLVLASCLALFLELALIRWLPANVLSIAYFSNIVLISAFLGLGLGCALAPKEEEDTFRWFPVILLCSTVLFILFRFFETIIPAEGSEWIWSGYGSNVMASSINRLDIFSAIAVVYVLCIALFFLLGQKIGSLIAGFSPLHAYSLDITGSLLGVLAFGTLAFAGRGSSPTIWFSVAAVLTLALLLLRRSLPALFVGASCLAATVLLVQFSGTGELWSPYYSIHVRSESDGTLKLFVNKFFHQQTIDFDNNDEGVEKYGLPYRITSPKSVLVLGAGTGNDVAMALRQGAASVTAVEIDQVILELGDRHPARPYADPRVTAVMDDARSFLRKETERFDMVILGTLDSHALLSALSTIRLDNFVYTTESLRAVRDHISSDGVTALMFSVPDRWLKEKLIQSVATVFDSSEMLVYEGDESLFNLLIIAGPGVKSDRAEASVTAGIFQRIDSTGSAAVKVPTDDWPYLYLKRPTVPSHYVKALVLLLLLSATAVFLLSVRQKPGRSGMTFFFLGAAFLLLETKSVTTLSLLFGSTWLVNVFVFAGIFITILLANLWVSARAISRIWIPYALLFCALALNYFYPVGNLLSLDFWTRSLLGTVLVSLPILFASVIFSFHFKSAKHASAMFGINLMGAVLGGFLEYGSMVTGLNSLYLIAALFYAVSFVTGVVKPKRNNIIA